MPKMRFRTLIKIPDLITLTTLICGMLSIFLASKQYFTWAAILLITGVILDRLDGLVAKLIKRKGRFGAELDSLSDAINFGAAPALFGFFLGLKDFFSIVVLTIFTLVSVLRLARFNVTKKTFNYFLGFPTTYNGLVFPILYFIFSLTHLPWDTTKWIYLAFYLISSLLMASTIKIPKIIISKM